MLMIIMCIPMDELVVSQRPLNASRERERERERAKQHFSSYSVEVTPGWLRDAQSLGSKSLADGAGVAL